MLPIHRLKDTEAILACWHLQKRSPCAVQALSFFYTWWMLSWTWLWCILVMQALLKEGATCDSVPKGFYHHSCYQNYTNKTNLTRLQKRRERMCI